MKRPLKMQESDPLNSAFLASDRQLTLTEGHACGAWRFGKTNRPLPPYRLRGRRLAHPYLCEEANALTATPCLATVNGNTVRSFPTHGPTVRSERKLNHCLTR
jgi:hypothetical protein